MEEEIEHIEKNKTWTLVPRQEDKKVIGTVYTNLLARNTNLLKRNKH